MKERRHEGELGEERKEGRKEERRKGRREREEKERR